VRRANLTSRAAILAVVFCVIGLSLAYPIREYVAQRREISALRQQQQTDQQHVRKLSAQQQQLGDPAYIKDQARTRLHMCDPGATCYIVLNGDDGDTGTDTGTHPATPPWYVTLWRSVNAAGRDR
jgi:cell division protein FtsB